MDGASPKVATFFSIHKELVPFVAEIWVYHKKLKVREDVSPADLSFRLLKLMFGIPEEWFVKRDEFYNEELTKALLSRVLATNGWGDLNSYSWKKFTDALVAHPLLLDQGYKLIKTCTAKDLEIDAKDPVS